MVEAARLTTTFDNNIAKHEADMRRAESAFKRAESQAKSSAASIKSSFSGNLSGGFASGLGIQQGSGMGGMIGGAAGGLLKSGVSMIFGEVRSLTEQGLAFADSIQIAKIGFTSMLGDAQKASAFVREMAKFGAETPFRTDELLTYAQQMMAVGVEAGKVKEMITGIGDAAASSGKFDKMRQAVLAISQMLSKGKVSAEEMNQQLAEAIPGAKGFMARGMGITEQQLTKDMEAGRINPQAAIELMTLQMSKERGGAMEKMRHTIAGSRSEKEDKMAMAAANALTGGDTFGAATADSVYRKNVERNIRRGDTVGRLGSQFGSTVAGAGGMALDAEAYLEEQATSPMAGRQGVMDFYKSITDGTVVGKAKDVAANVVGTITSTISAGAAGAQAASTSLASSLWDGMANFWEVQSPSKRAERLGIWISEGLEMGLSKRQAGNYGKLKSLSEKEPDFVRKLIAGSQARGINPDHMANVIGMESSFNPQADNPNSSAYGLIQWMAATRKAQGVTQGQLSKMSATQQLDEVFKYFDQPHLKGKLGTQAGLYSAVGAGQASSDDNAVRFRSGSAGYNANRVWDANKDGTIRQGEFGTIAHRALGAGEKFSVMGGAGGGGVPSRSAPLPVTIIEDHGGGMTARFGSSAVEEHGGGSRIRFGSVGQRSSGSRTIEDTVPVLVDVIGTAEQLTTTFQELGNVSHLALLPLQEMPGALAASTEARMTELRAGMYNPEEAKKKKKDRLYDKEFTREGVAGDFKGELEGMFGEFASGNFKGGAAGFGKGMLKNIQSRMMADLAGSITQGLFGGRGESGQLQGGLLSGIMGSLFGGGGGGGGGAGAAAGGGGGFLSKILGSLFGGGRAQGGWMDKNKFHLVGERGPELLGPGTAGKVTSNNDLAGLIKNQGASGSGGETRIINMIDQDVMHSAVKDYLQTPKGGKLLVNRISYHRDTVQKLVRQ